MACSHEGTANKVNFEIVPCHGKFDDVHPRGHLPRPKQNVFLFAHFSLRSEEAQREKKNNDVGVFSGGLLSRGSSRLAGAGCFSSSCRTPEHSMDQPGSHADQAARRRTCTRRQAESTGGEKNTNTPGSFFVSFCVLRGCFRESPGSIT